MPFGWPTPSDAWFGDVVADLAVLLRAQLPTYVTGSVDVSTDLTQFDRGDRALLLERAGGRRDRFGDNAHVLFEARGSHHDDAYDIAMAARAVAWASPKAIEAVTHVEDMSGPLRMVDPVNQALFYRFSMMFRVKAKAFPGI